MANVSVLMAVYNGMPYLPLAMESILNQTFDDFEFIIVNDCSTDETRDVILGYNDPRIRLFDNEENIRQTKSLNKGMAYVETDFIARMDADDISDLNRLALQYEYMIEKPDIAVLGSQIRYIDVEERVIGQQLHPEHNDAIRWMQLFYCPITNGAAMFRTKVIRDELKGYDASVSVSQDWELWGRVPAQYQLANLPDFLLDVRIHDQQYSKTDLGRAEEIRINRKNPERILGIKDQSEAWLKKVDLLLWDAREESRKRPQDFLDVVERLFTEFTKKYPQSVSDPYILEQLALLYFRAAENAGFRHLGVAKRALGLARHVASKDLFLKRLGRFLVVSLGARKIRRWFLGQ